MCAAVFLLLAFPDTPPAEPAVNRPKVQAVSTAWQLFTGGVKSPTTRVITTPGELAVFMGKPVSKEKEALALAARTLKVKSLDLGTHMLVVIVGKEQPTSGYSIEVTKWTPKDNGLTIAWKVQGPPPGSLVASVLSTPGVVLLVDRVPGKVMFDPAIRPARKK